MTPPAATDRPIVGTYRNYAEAQRAVDFLSDEKFPVERTAIIGSDLKMVETVTGRLTSPRAAAAGAGSGAWFGLFVGLLLTFFTEERAAVLPLLLGGIIIGAVFGAVFGFIAHSMTGGRRDFTSRSQIVAGCYDVVADAEVAEDAKNRLIKLSWRED